MALDVYLTNACNLRCKFCFNLDREDAPRIPLDSICAILKAAYDRGHRYVSITGGEPFLYKQVFDVIQYAHDLGYWINILSHGGLLNSEKINKLKQFWRLRVRISLDGPDRATHDPLRGSGTFDSTMEKIGLLVNHGVNVGIGATISEQNIQTVKDIFQLCVDKKVTFIRFSPVARVKKGKAATVSALLHERLLETIIELTINNQHLIDIPHNIAIDLNLAISTLTTRRCMAGKRFFGITPDQKVLPCPLLVEHTEVPTAYFDGGQCFDTLGAKMDQMFEAANRNLGGICKTCEFREVCYGGCLAEKFSFDRQVEDEQPVCTKLILERLASKFARGDLERIARGWAYQLEASQEADRDHACMRQAPYWSINLKSQDRWSSSHQRFN
jgi:radical SAM protein with 4Fe4S-binding SPASM domain